MEIVNPDFWVVDSILRENKGDPSTLLQAYPHFDPLGIPEDERCSGSNREQYLYVAVEHRCLDTARGLVQCGVSLSTLAKYNTSVLWWVCAGNASNEGMEIVAWLLSHWDVRRTINVCTTVDDCCSPLHLAAENGYLPLVYILIAHGADPMLEDANGHRASHVAYDNQYYNVSYVLEGMENTRKRELEILEIGEWRPHNHARFPLRCRLAMRTLAILAKARLQRGSCVLEDNTRMLDSRYPKSCLELLPEEILQYLFVYVVCIPIPDIWVVEKYFVYPIESWRGLNNLIYETQ